MNAISSDQVHVRCNNFIGNVNVWADIVKIKIIEINILRFPIEYLKTRINASPPDLKFSQISQSDSSRITYLFYTYYYTYFIVIFIPSTNVCSNIEQHFQLTHTQY